MRSETIRWPWLIAGVMLIAGPAAADETEPSPAAPQAKYRLALMDVEPAAGSQQAAALALAALREVAAADERFDLAADEDLARARALWGKGVMVLTPEGLIDSDALANNTMNHTQACAIGHTAGAARLLMVSGYALELAPMGAPAAAPMGGQAPCRSIGCRRPHRHHPRPDRSCRSTGQPPDPGISQRP